MTVIGLTGSFGTGKTFVASIFKSLGAKVLDADRLAHRALKKGTSVYKRIVGAFGERILDEGRHIDRKKLAGIVFADRNRLNKLNRIVHPEVIKEIKKTIKRASKEDVIVIDAPLLIEANLRGVVDKLIVVTLSKKSQIDRCMKKFRIKKAHVLRRIKNQIPLKEKVKMADFVIDNDGAKSETRRQVREIWGEISRNIT